jgi:hypothetical protein
VCQPDGSPSSVVQYRIEGDSVYQIGFSTDLSAADLAVIRATTLSLRTGTQ